MLPRSIVREIAETFMVVMLIFLALQITVRTYQIEGYSMAPTMGHTDYILVNKIVYAKFDTNVWNNILPFVDVESQKVMFPFHSPQRGEIVVFKYPEDESREFVKRVVGIPGDMVEIKKGFVYVNSEKITEKYVSYRDNDSTKMFDVGPHSYFVLGDNRISSNDSRDWGVVPAKNIIGKPWVTIWSSRNSDNGIFSFFK